MRKPFQGVGNIVRFNWHFYVIALGLVLALMITASFFDGSLRSLIYLIMVLVFMSSLLSLLASYYVYDLSGLYDLKWIEEEKEALQIININAGFDETSVLLKDKFEKAQLLALDFYDPTKHTEVSIKRARKAYPPFPGTQPIKTTDLPIADDSTDKIFVILAAHEIRVEEERIQFFNELGRIVKSEGLIYITEHLRDPANFLVYNIGFLHFYSKKSWLNTFKQAELSLKKEIKITPFISTFILEKNGSTT